VACPAGVSDGAVESRRVAGEAVGPMSSLGVLWVSLDVMATCVRG